MSAVRRARLGHEASDPPRVALVLASSTGGVGTHVRALAYGLAERGIAVTVHGPEAAERQFHFARPAGPDRPGPGSAEIRFAAVEIPANPNLRDLRTVRRLRRSLTAERTDIVHAHGLRAGLVAGWARPARLPLVVTWHNAVLAHGLRGRVYALLERRVARLADITLAASTDMVTRATRLGSRDARLGAVTAPTLSPSTRDRASIRRELEVSDGTPLVLSVGRLHPQKGYETLVEAATRWLDRDPVPSVLIAGSGPSLSTLTDRIVTTGAPVRLLGHRTDVADLLVAADLAVVSSVWEARQLFAQEALRAGVPLVGTAVGGMPELLGDAAVLVHAGDVAALDGAVRTLLDDPDRCRAMADAGRARARTWPSDKDTVTRILGVYEELTGSL